MFGSLLAFLDPQVKATSASPSRHSGSVTGGSKKHETMLRSLKLDPQVKATSASPSSSLLGPGCTTYGLVAIAE